MQKTHKFTSSIVNGAVRLGREKGKKNAPVGLLTDLEKQEDAGTFRLNVRTGDAVTDQDLSEYPDAVREDLMARGVLVPLSEDDKIPNDAAAQVTGDEHGAATSNVATGLPDSNGDLVSSVDIEDVAGPSDDIL